MHDGESALPLKLEGFLPYRLARAAELVSRDFSALYRKRHGLTRPEWRVFATIGQFGRITAKEIAIHSAMHKTKVSRAVASLAARRWITRAPDPGDRRVEHLDLTEEGRRCYRDLAALARGYERGLLEDLGAAAAADLVRGLDALERRKARG